MPSKVAVESTENVNFLKYQVNCYLNVPKEGYE